MACKWICVGISGSTNAGKSTLAAALQSHFPGSIAVNQDTYFRKDDSPEHIVVPELNHKNWERLEAVDWVAMMECINKVMNSPPPSKHSLLIIEGHIIFNHPELRDIFHKRYFLTLNKEECIKRRVRRVYDPPDIPGYFDICVWPMYLTNLEEVKKNCSDIFYLDGSEKRERIQEIVISDLTDLLQKNVLENNK